MKEVTVYFSGHVKVEVPEGLLDEEQYHEMVEAMASAYNAVHALDGALYIDEYIDENGEGDSQ